MKKWTARLIAMLMTAAVLLLFPHWLRIAREREPIPKSLLPEDPVWQGTLEIWDVPACRTGRGDAAGYLRLCIRAFEKTHRGVFCTLRVRSADEAGAELAKGITPDVLSFGCGFLRSPDGLLSFSLPQSLEPTLGEAVGGGSESAVLPYLLSGYALLSKPAEAEAFGAAGLNAAPWFALSHCLKDARDLPLLEMTREENLSAFEEGTLSALCCTMGEAVRLRTRAEEKGEDMGSLSPLVTESGALYTDQVQFISAYRTEDAQKEEIEREFLLFLLSDAMQQKAGKVGALPAIRLEEEIYPPEEPLSLWEKALREKGLTCPKWDTDLKALDARGKAALKAGTQPSAEGLCGILQ